MFLFFIDKTLYINWFDTDFTIKTLIDSDFTINCFCSQNEYTNKSASMSKMNIGAIREIKKP